MADKTETTTKINVGIGSVSHKRTSSPTKRTYRYSCEVEFDDEDSARDFRHAVEQGSSDSGGRMMQSSLEAVETTK